jgi:hypothetical protein
MSTTEHTATVGAGHAPPVCANPSQVPRLADTGAGTVLRFPTGDARPFGVTDVFGEPRHAWRPEAQRRTAGPRVRHCDGLAAPGRGRVLHGHGIIGEALHG